MATSRSTTTRCTPSSTIRIPTALVAGSKSDKEDHKKLHLHIWSDNETFEDSGIGLDEQPTDQPALKVLATPPSGKKKNLASSPKSAPIECLMSAISFTKEITSSRTTTTRDMSTSQRSSYAHPVASGPLVTSNSMDANCSPDVLTSSATSSPGIFSSLRGTVSRSLSSSASIGCVSKVADSQTTSRTSFQTGSDSEDEATSISSGRSSRNSSGKSASGARLPEAKGKGRFRRMLNPLRRSHSAGCSQDVPAHALFLKHNMDSKSEKTLSTSLKSVDKSPSPSPAPQIARATGSDSDGEDTDRKSSKSKKKSLARDLKDKMAFLRRRHTETTLSSKVDGKSDRPSAESVSDWSRDLDHLLQDKVGLDMFRHFLQSEFSDENLEFWLACEEYKTLRDGKMPLRAQTIYTDFVATQAPREINLDSKTRYDCRSALSSPTKSTFEQAQKRITGLMEKDSYPRFLKSHTYLELCHELKLNPAS